MAEDIKEKMISRPQNLWGLFTTFIEVFREKGWFTLRNRQKANASLQLSVSLQDTTVQPWQRNSSLKLHASLKNTIKTLSIHSNVGGKEETLVLGLRLKAFTFLGRTLFNQHTQIIWRHRQNCSCSQTTCIIFFFLKKLKITLLRTVIQHSS